MNTIENNLRINSKRTSYCIHMLKICPMRFFFQSEHCYNVPFGVQSQHCYVMSFGVQSQHCYTAPSVSQA